MVQVADATARLRRRWGSATFLVFVVAVVLSTSLVQSSTSDARGLERENWRPERGGACVAFASLPCLADSPTHDWQHDLGPKMLTATFDTLGNSYGTTDLSVQFASGHTTTVDAFYRYDTEDVITDPYTLGKASCQTVSAGDEQECDHYHVLYNDDTLSLAFFADHPDRLKSVACHETGHTVGLLHGESGRPALDPAAASIACVGHPSSISEMLNAYAWDWHLGTHNVTHINGHY